MYTLRKAKSGAHTQCIETLQVLGAKAIRLLFLALIDDLRQVAIEIIYSMNGVIYLMNLVYITTVHYTVQERGGISNYSSD